jgi:hypothetical protein
MNCVTKLNPMLVGVVLMLFSTLAVAGATNAKIQSVLIWEDGGLVYVYPAGGVSNPPACHGSNGNYYSFSLVRRYAREYLAGLLAAQASGATVTFYGTGICVDQSVSETLSYYSINSQ